MPFRLGEHWPNRAKIQFTTSAAMPSLIYRACLATGVVSNTVYCQRALVAALARDLGIEEAELLADLPTPRGPAGHLYQREGHPTYGVRIGPANTVEAVR